MIIYRATNVVNNKSYIGLTLKSLASRKAKHLNSLQREDSKFYRAIKKYGRDSFKWEIIHQNITDYELLKRLEKNYIAILRPEYNSTNGGDGSFGYKHSDKAKQRMSEVKKNLPIEERRKVGLSNRGRKLTEEHERKISKTLSATRRNAIA